MTISQSTLSTREAWELCQQTSAGVALTQPPGHRHHCPLDIQLSEVVTIPTCMSLSKLCNLNMQGLDKSEIGEASALGTTLGGCVGGSQNVSNEDRYELNFSVPPQCSCAEALTPNGMAFRGGAFGR